MSKLDELIAELCPEGVEYKNLDEIGIFFSGLSGKSKNDFSNGNAKFVTYMNVFSNLSIEKEINDFVKIEKGERQNTIKYGDILFTGSSETPEESGMSCVFMQETKDPIYLNSFCFGFRLSNSNILLPDFSKYLFRSEDLRKQIIRTASGVTRFNISKAKMGKVRIPIPPLPIQHEIVRILDTFTELEAELEARKKQYEYYRDKLLTPVEQDGKWLLKGKKVEWKTLEEICFYPNKRISIDKVNNKNYIGVDNLLQNKQGKTDSNYVPKIGNLVEYLIDDILIGNIRPYLKKIWLADINGGTNGDVIVIRIKEEWKITINSRFLYYYLSSDEFFKYDMQYAKGAKMPRGSRDAILKYKIPIPPLSEQQRIVAILDRFDALCNDLTSGLPAEIEARRKQYEYYRDKLLTFREAKA